MTGICTLCRGLLGNTRLCINCVEVREARANPNDAQERRSMARRFDDRAVYTGFGALESVVAHTDARDERQAPLTLVGERQVRRA